jgi:hypothetical protein
LQTYYIYIFKTSKSNNKLYKESHVLTDVQHEQK